MAGVVLLALMVAFLLGRTPTAAAARRALSRRE